MKFKQIFAFAGAVLLVLLYLSTLVFALIDHPLAPNLLSAALFCTVVIPTAIYGYMLILRHLKKREKDQTD